MSDETPLCGAILCAGRGTRMHPITEVLPKPLIPFLGTPMIAYPMSHLLSAGVSRVGVNLHHLADAVPPVVDRLAEVFGQSVTYAREWSIMGTAGGVRGIWEALGEPEGQLVVLNGDSVMNLDLLAHVEAHRASGARATMVVRPKADTQPGRVWLTEEGELWGLRDARRAGSPGALVEHDFVGVHILDAELIAEIPLEEGCMVGDVYIPMLERGEPIHASVMEGFWAAIDNPRLMLDTQRRCMEEPGLFAQAPFPDPLADGLFVYSAADVADKAQLAGPVFIGAQAAVGDGARIGPNALVDGSEIAPGAIVRNAVVYGMGTVEGEWVDCVAVAGKVASAE
jgi:mannose-1-phosphate guanylyltransferase